MALWPHNNCYRCPLDRAVILPRRTLSRRSPGPILAGIVQVGHPCRATRCPKSGVSFGPRGEPHLWYPAFRANDTGFPSVPRRSCSRLAAAACRP